LDYIDFDGKIILDDDSQIGGKSLLQFNLIYGKSSIYCKYGFRYDPSIYYNKIKPFQEFITSISPPVLNEKGIKDIKYNSFLETIKDQLKKFDLRLIPMINKNYREYLGNSKICKFEAKCEEEKEEETDLKDIIRYTEKVLLQQGFLLKSNPVRIEPLKTGIQITYDKKMVTLIQTLKSKNLNLLADLIEKFI
jgi:hypothetical protein